MTCNVLNWRVLLNKEQKDEIHYDRKEINICDINELDEYE